MIPRRLAPAVSLRAGLRTSQALRPSLANQWRLNQAVLAQRGGLLGARQPRKWESTSTGDEQSGHIAASPNESILFIDNLFPLKLSNVFGLWHSERDLADLLRNFKNSSLSMIDPIRLVKRAMPSDERITVTEIVPRLKDGGAFVKFTHPADITPKEIELSIRQQMEADPIKPWFNPFRPIKAGLVKGVPWLEDLHRFPKGRIKIEFVSKAPGSEAVELSQETLFSVFRRYGKIADITSQPPDSKITPRFAYVDFVLVRDAIMARNCTHGLVLAEDQGGGSAGTKLQTSYEQRVKAHKIWDWLTNHPRIVIPLVAALIAALTVVIFDPIREFFVKAHVQQSFRISNSRLYKWFKRQTSDIFSFRKKSEAAGLMTLWNHRKDVIDQVRGWILETTDTFIVIQGPVGSGKRELVLDQALKGRDNVLVIDCKPIIEARGESGTIKQLAAAVGYHPVFSWANNLSSLIDLGVQSATGVKAGFSETFESQIVKILQTSAAALKTVSLSKQSKDAKDSALSEDAFLEAHPEGRAVVVIDNFLHKSEDSGIIYDKIAEWAAGLVQSNIAQVVFLTNDTAYSKSLSKSLPDRIFYQLALGDLSPDVAKKFVLSHFEPARVTHEEASEEEKRQAEATHARRYQAELDESIRSLGGRLTDLEAFARRLQSGQSPKHAVDEIIEQSASEILKVFLLAGNNRSGSSSGGRGGGGSERKWSVEQAWHLIKQIAQHESLRYNEVLLSNTFAASATPGAGDGEAALETLAGAELISVTQYRGRPQTIRAGRPVYQPAFAALVRDDVLRAKMDLAVLAELAGVEAKAIAKVEAELGLLGALPHQPRQTADRIAYLLAQLQGSQVAIAGYEAEMGRLKKILVKEA